MPSTRSPRFKRVVTEQLIEQLAGGDHTPTDLAREHAVPLSKLAAWASDPANMRVLAGLSHLADVRAQMLLSRYRANAAAQLITIATAKEPTELSRKACVDLLKTDLDVFNQDDAAAIEQAVDERAIIQALEQLGREPGDE